MRPARFRRVTTVQVGTQVSGTIESLYADFNSLVKKGQVLARLDPSLFQTQIEQARANLIRAQADLERLKVSLDDARTKLARAQELSARQLIPQNELETAQVNVRSIEAQIRSSEAQVTQARASLNQNDVNLQHTVITAPIDGLVISRNVDVGQTVAASMQAPTLFILAADLTKMQVVANLDESDVGRIRPGQHVTFRVDAYPADDFDGSVSQVRLQPIVQQNVVTYATVIDVPNPALKLKPGMTANVNIEINQRANVLRVPNAALRFRPTNEIFAALGQTPPDPAQLRASGARMAPAARRPAPAVSAARQRPGAAAGRADAQPAGRACSAPLRRGQRRPRRRAARQAAVAAGVRGGGWLWRARWRRRARCRACRPRSGALALEQLRARGGSRARRRAQLTRPAAHAAIHRPRGASGRRGQSRSHDIRRALCSPAAGRERRTCLAVQDKQLKPLRVRTRRQRRSEHRTARRRSGGRHRARHQRDHRGSGQAGRHAAASRAWSASARRFRGGGPATAAGGGGGRGEAG